MPIAPAAKGIIIVSGILVAASIALYENEHVREWVENTGRKISGVWDDIINFDQRQRQRRAMPHGYAMGEPQELASRSVQERRDARRKLYESAEQKQGPGSSANEATGVTVVTGNVENEGLRKRKARGEESQEHLLGEAHRNHEAEKPNEVLFDQVEDPAISVPELQPEVVESTADVQIASGLRSLQSSPFFSTKGSLEDVSVPVPNLIDYDMPASFAKDEPLSHETPASATQTEKLNHETSSPLPPPTISNAQDSNSITQPIIQSPSNVSTTTATGPLTLSIPPTPRSRTLSTSTLSPVQIHTPTSVSSFSSPTSYGDGGIHTPSRLGDEDFDAMSDAGTETASQVSEWRDEQRDGIREDDMMSVASEESGWSEVGEEVQERSGERRSA